MQFHSSLLLNLFMSPFFANFFCLPLSESYLHLYLFHTFLFFLFSLLFFSFSLPYFPFLSLFPTFLFFLSFLTILFLSLLYLPPSTSDVAHTKFEILPQIEYTKDIATFDASPSLSYVLPGGSMKVIR